MSMRVNRRGALLLRNAALVATTVLVSQLAAQEIAFTWDDLPAHSALPPGQTREEIARQIVSAMKQANMPPAFGFVNGATTRNEPLSAPVLEEWRKAGLPLGNHTWSHMNLNQRSLVDWEADVLRNEPLLQFLMATQDWRWLRFPFLAEGDTQEKREGARRFLAEHHYRIAGVTMSFGDYLYNEPYARCVAKNDTAGVEKLETSYLAAASGTITYTRSMSKALYGRDIPYVLLMHIGALDARVLPRLLKLYRDNGFRFIRLEEAEKDPFYRNDVDLSLPPGPDSLEQMMKQHNLPLPKHQQSDIDFDAVCR